LLLVALIAMSSLSKAEKTTLAFLGDDDDDIVVKKPKKPIAIKDDPTGDKKKDDAGKGDKIIDLQPTKPKEKEEVIDKLLGIIGKGANVYKNVVDAFKTERKSEIVKEIKREGFDSINQSAEFQFASGIDAEFFQETWIPGLLNYFEVPEDKKNQFRIALQTSLKSEKNAWNSYNLFFDKDKQEDNNMYSASILSYLVDEPGVKPKYYAMYMIVKTKFKLATQYYLVKNSLSVAGGIWSDAKDLLQPYQKNITDEDVKALTVFYEVGILSTLSKYFGAKFEFPPLNWVNWLFS